MFNILVKNSRISIAKFIYQSKNEYFNKLLNMVRMIQYNKTSCFYGAPDNVFDAILHFTIIAKQRL